MADSESNRKARETIEDNQRKARGYKQAAKDKAASNTRIGAARRAKKRNTGTT
jgi:hypothetical protein